MTVSGEPGVLWHYTNAAGLKGIVEDQCVFATDADYLNDSSELSYAWEVAEEALEDLAQEDPSVADLCVKAQGYGELVDGLESVNVFCLCAQPDVLSLWRAYAGGSGFAIGFDAAALRDGLSFRIPPSVMGDPAYGLQPVLYERDEQKARLRQEILAGIDLHRARGWADDEGLNAVVGSIRSCLRLISPFIKHPAFESECEWRASQFLIFTIPHDDFLARPTGLVPFVRFRMWRPGETGLEQDRLPIRAVMVGPGLHQAPARKSAQLLLSKANYDPDIVQSSLLPLRV